MFTRPRRCRGPIGTMASAPRCRWFPPSRRPRCAGRAARRDRSRCRARCLVHPAGRRCASPLSRARSSNDKNQGETIFRQIDVFDRVAGSRARKSNVVLVATKSAIAFRLASDRANNAGRPRCVPPISGRRRSSTHSIEGVSMVSPRKMPSVSLPLLVRRNTFGIGQAGSCDSSRATARGESASMPAPLRRRALFARTRSRHRVFPRRRASRRPPTSRRRSPGLRDRP